MIIYCKSTCKPECIFNCLFLNLRISRSLDYIRTNDGAKIKWKNIIRAYGLSGILCFLGNHSSSYSGNLHRRKAEVNGFSAPFPSQAHDRCNVNKVFSHTRPFTRNFEAIWQRLCRGLYNGRITTSEKDSKYSATIIVSTNLETSLPLTYHCMQAMSAFVSDNEMLLKAKEQNIELLEVSINKCLST